MDNILFGRTAKLSLGLGNNTKILDLSDLQFRFQTQDADRESPNTAVIRIYNLSEKTKGNILKEFVEINLEAGYGKNYSVIFNGTIKQFRFGKENNVTTYMDIFSADGDVAYNFGFMNITLPAGSTNMERIKTVADGMGLKLDPSVQTILGTGGVVDPRGKVLFGLGREYCRDLAYSHSATWSIQKGALVLVPLKGYLPGTIIEVNSKTGLIGTPENTDQGVFIRTLLNPLVRIGGLIHINEALINQTVIKHQAVFPNYGALYFPAAVTSDGYYRVIIAEHSGDTRGQEWYTDMTCISVNTDNVVNPSDKAGQ